MLAGLFCAQTNVSGKRFSHPHFVICNGFGDAFPARCTICNGSGDALPARCTICNGFGDPLPALFVIRNGSAMHFPGCLVIAGLRAKVACGQLYPRDAAMQSRDGEGDSKLSPYLVPEKKSLGRQRAAAILRDFMTEDIAIDLGTANTLV